jgi:hypothetical protein
MDETAEDLVRRLHREEVERVHHEGPSFQRPVERSAIPCNDLPPASPDSPLVAEWDAYRNEVGRLLAEGREGQFVLIKGERIVGLCSTEREALDLANRLFPSQAFLVHQVQAKEPLLRCVSVRLWPR